MNNKNINTMSNDGMDNSVITRLRNHILESFENIEYKRFMRERISSTVLSNLKNDIAKYNRLFENSKESIFFEGLYHNVCVLCKTNINESGFNNPFRKGVSKEQDNREQLQSFNKLGPGYTMPDSDNVNVISLKIWNPNKPDKTYYKDGSIYAGRHFSKGDTVEMCPTRYLSGRDIVTKPIHDFSFVIDKEQNLYAIPFGKAIFYKNSVETGQNGNVDYEFIETYNDSRVDGYIVIKALRNIRANEELILKSDEHDFANVMKDDDFEYTRPRRNVEINTDTF